MSEIVKVDGAWNLTPELAQQMGKTMPQLIKYFKENIVLPHIDKKIKDNNLTGKAVSKARDGFGKILVNGEQVYLSGLRNYQRQLENDKIQLPTFVSKGKLQKSVERRQDAVELQTSPDVELFNWKTKPKEMEAHHIRMLKMYAPFYEGLSKKDAKELTQWFVDEGYPLGDAKANLQLMNPKAHKEIHRWMIDNRIQVQPGPPGFSNFQLSNLLSIGPNVRGGVDGQLYDGPAPKFPNLAHLPLNERLTAASIFLKYVQDPIEEKLSSLINVDSIQQSEFDRRKAELEAGYKRTEKVIAKEQELPTAVKDFAQEAWDVGMDAVGLGAVKNTVRAGQAVINKDPVSALINVASIRHETIEPLAKRSEYKAIAADIAGK
tara:strand:- start:22 stop:1152 length:1131 start_codon:yes stop_codon:yes gene_type:complete